MKSNPTRPTAGLVVPCAVCGRNVLRAAAVFWFRGESLVFGCTSHRDEARKEMVNAPATA
jgi:hypothetical protein